MGTFLQQLAEDVNQELEVRIELAGRKQETVRARKLFCYIADLLDYGPSVSGKAFNKDHATAIFHAKTFPDVATNKEINAYNAIIEKRGLPLDKLENARVLRQSPTMVRIVNKLAKMNPSDLKYFESKRLDVFLDQLEKEQEYKTLIHD